MAVVWPVRAVRAAPAPTIESETTSASRPTAPAAKTSGRRLIQLTSVPPSVICAPGYRAMVMTLNPLPVTAQLSPKTRPLPSWDRPGRGSARPQAVAGSGGTRSRELRREAAAARRCEGTVNVTSRRAARRPPSEGPGSCDVGCAPDRDGRGAPGRVGSPGGHGPGGDAVQ